jgi:hypothetical protein
MMSDPPADPQSMLQEVRKLLAESQRLRAQAVALDRKAEQLREDITRDADRPKSNNPG